MNNSVLQCLTDLRVTKQYYHYHEQILTCLVKVAKQLFLEIKNKEEINTKEVLQEVRRIKNSLKGQLSIKARKVARDIETFETTLKVLKERNHNKLTENLIAILNNFRGVRRDCFQLINDLLKMWYILNALKKDEIKDALKTRLEELRIFLNGYKGYSWEIQQDRAIIVEGYRECWQFLLSLWKTVIRKLSDDFLSDEFVQLVYRVSHNRDFTKLVLKTGEQLISLDSWKRTLKEMSKLINNVNIAVIAKKPKYNGETTDIFIEYSMQMPGKTFWIIPRLVLFIECKLQMIKDEYDEVDKFEKQFKNLIKKAKNMIEHYYRFICGKNNLPRIVFLLISNKEISKRIIEKARDLLKDLDECCESVFIHLGGTRIRGIISKMLNKYRFNSELKRIFKLFFDEANNPQLSASLHQK